jgi:hypothetical protein
MAQPAYGIPYAAPQAAPYAPAPSGEQQIDALSAQAEYFEKALDDIRKRIDELQGEKNGD